eukprot:4798819-Pyramimonas_sp.AAC.1
MLNTISLLTKPPLNRNITARARATSPVCPTKEPLAQNQAVHIIHMIHINVTYQLNLVGPQGAHGQFFFEVKMIESEREWVDGWVDG